MSVAPVVLGVVLLVLAALMLRHRMGWRSGSVIAVVNGLAGA